MGRHREGQQRRESRALAAARSIGIEQQQRRRQDADPDQHIGHGETGEERQGRQHGDDGDREQRAHSPRARERHAPQRRHRPRDHQRLGDRYQPQCPRRLEAVEKHGVDRRARRHLGMAHVRVDPGLSEVGRRPVGWRDQPDVGREFLAERVIIVGVGEHRRVAAGNDASDDQQRADDDDQPLRPARRSDDHAGGRPGQRSAIHAISATALPSVQPAMTSVGQWTPR